MAVRARALRDPTGFVSALKNGVSPDDIIDAIFSVLYLRLWRCSQ